MNQNKELHVVDEVESMNEQLAKSYVAGVIDGGSSVTVNVGKDDSYAVGYRISPKIQITKNLPFALQFIDDFCL